ncbi:MAG: amidophosphoribosyltransferase [Anaerolineae bacterium]|nr:amidophosphoribosyltransferase [Anaerolineae bacterium]MDW8067394.1 amidophosphoribosyltransferase [Anaerolineae bacterium]
MVGKPREACGVFGIYAPGEDVARLTFFALFALQHRGQESAGIAVSDGRVVRMHKAMGLVSQVFTEDILGFLKGDLAIGHNRYSTTGTSRLANAQPFLMETALGPLALAHNGNLTNAPSLRRALLSRGVGLTSSSDTELIVQMLAGAAGATWEERIQSFMQEARGAYSLTILTRRAVYGVRDPWGFRPLCLGRLGEVGWVLASESCALATIGADFVREVQPGEVVRLDEEGMTSMQALPPSPRQALCVFEYIYFARPDSIFGDQSVHRVRRRLGMALAREHPADADMVMGVPDSATAHAIGYAHASGIPFGEGLIKNRYIGRTFIQPDDRLRRLGVALKFNPLPDSLRGKQIVLVDDSIVRGTTSGPIVQMLRRAGAAAIHLRVASPPIRHPCFMGVDMATYEELIAHHMSVPEIGHYIGVDSIGYLSIEGLKGVVGESGLCMACFSGDYPLEVEVPAIPSRMVMEWCEEVKG